MLIIILAIVIALVAWSLHLMQQAVDRQEFSLMLAGTLVAFSAAAMVGVYFLMGNYVGYVMGTSHYSFSDPQFSHSRDIQVVGNTQTNHIPLFQAEMSGRSIDFPSL